jgi:MFS family permease
MLLPAVLAMAVGSPFAGRMLDRTGSRIVLFMGTALIAAGMAVVALLGTNMIFFYLSPLLAGLGLGILLGAPLRYVMLNEAPASERASAQGILTLNTSIGQLVGGALVGAVAASLGGGVSGYAAAFLAAGTVMLALSVLTLAMKRRAEELLTARRNHEITQVSPVETAAR